MPAATQLTCLLDAGGGGGGVSTITPHSLLCEINDFCGEQ